MAHDSSGSYHQDSGARPYKPAAGGRPFGGPVLRPLPRRAYALRVAAFPFVWPLFLALMRGAFVDFVAVGAAMVLLFLGARRVDEGLAADREGTLGRLAGGLVPPRLLGAAATGLAGFLVSVGATNDGALMSLISGGLAYLGCALAYGTEPGFDRAGLAAIAKRAVARAPKEVAGALGEARRKIGEIEAAAAALHSLELKERLARIVGQARDVLAQVERNPRDLSRARRFFVTYLDGTRDVVAKYAAQQHDVAQTPLAENFRRVLTTVEQVFAEQRDRLRRDDATDLEVKIEVLETQMRREGVH